MRLKGLYKGPAVWTKHRMQVLVAEKGGVVLVLVRLCRGQRVCVQIASL